MIRLLTMSINPVKFVDSDTSFLNKYQKGVLTERCNDDPRFQFVRFSLSQSTFEKVVNTESKSFGSRNEDEVRQVVLSVFLGGLKFHSLYL